MADERVLTARELNRALLARQLLLRRARLSVPRAIERVGALQAQWPPSPYVALWSRLEGFTPGRLLRALERRQVVKATLMRTTLHHVSAQDYLAYGGELFRARIEMIERQLARHPEETDVAGLVREVVRLTTERPRSRPELLDFLGQPKLVVDERRPWLVWHLLSVKAALVHTPPSSVWRHNTAGVSFVPAAVWLGAEGADGDAAVAHLLARYLTAFGPATRADAAQWTGLPIGALQPGFERLRLRRFRDERGKELLDVLRGPLPSAATEAPPRFLPMWDSSLLAHDDRSRILPEHHRKTVIRRNGDVQRTFLVDGFVGGTWSLVEGRVELEPFEPLARDVRRRLELEGAALARFHEVGRQRVAGSAARRTRSRASANRIAS
jgi:winged helix DNA-binding protein